MSKHTYIAGPMRGYPEFNFPAFFEAQAYLEQRGDPYFNPAERDLAEGFSPYGLKGTLDELRDMNFSLRDALADDTEYICKHAERILLLPGWENSAGAQAERALGVALGLEICVFTPKLVREPMMVGWHETGLGA